MSYVDRLEGLVLEGKTTREISEAVGMSRGVVQWRLNKMGLNDKLKYAKPKWDESFFSKVTTPEASYTLGFLLGDSYCDDKVVEVTVSLKDRSIVDFISTNIGGNVFTEGTYIPKKRKFPRARLAIGNRNILTDLGKLFVTRKKKDRKIPIVKPNLERYLMLGFFDAEGCITWGRRKDRNRVWQKVSFTSSFNMLSGIQKILDKQDISSQLRPKSNEDCFVLEISSRKRVLSFLDYLYGDGSFIILNRKYHNAVALRRELGENGEAA